MERAWSSSSSLGRGEEEKIRKREEMGEEILTVEDLRHRIACCRETCQWPGLTQVNSACGWLSSNLCETHVASFHWLAFTACVRHYEIMSQERDAEGCRERQLQGCEWWCEA